MYKELEIVKMQIELELKDFEAESAITIMYDKFNGSYVSHIINEINDPELIATVEHRYPHLKVLNSTLGEIHKAVIVEMRMRENK